MDADALSTAVFVLGHEKGMSLIEKVGGVEAFLVSRTRRSGHSRVAVVT